MKKGNVKTFPVEQCQYIIVASTQLKPKEGQIFFLTPGILSYSK
jgi:hypothetical protein